MFHNIMMHRVSLVAAFAEADEGGVRVFQLRLAAFHPEIPPFLLKEIDIIARRDRPRIVVGFGIKRGEQGSFRRRAGPSWCCGS